MVKILLISIGLLGYSIGASQNYIPYYNLINEAEYDIYNGNYSKAERRLEQAFKIEKPHAKDAYLLAYCLDKRDTLTFRKRIEELLIYASENQGRTIHWMQQQPLSIKLERELYARIERNEAICHSVSKAINDTIDYFLEKDQEIRKVLVDSIDPYFGEESGEYKEYLIKMSANDSIYQTELLKYIRTEGYPGINKSGSNVVGTILVHIHPSLFEEYQCVLLVELKKGNILPFTYGSMIDRINCYMNGEAFYYAYTIGTEHCQPSNMEIISNRVSMGMNPYFNGPRCHVKFTSAQLLKLP